MQTLGIQEVADIFRCHPNTVRAKAKQLGGRKFGREWSFLESNILYFYEHGRLPFEAEKSDEQRCTNSTNVKTLDFGGSKSHFRDKEEYAQALKLPTKLKPKN